MTKKITQKEEREWLDWLDWAIVSSETHTKIQCECPDCGVTFDAWLQNHLVQQPLDRQMQEQTTDCPRCQEEQSEEEFSF